MKVDQIRQALDRFCPFSTAEPWDRVGLLVGDGEASVACALVCLDITPSVLEMAKQERAALIISHHPVIFDPLASLSTHSVPYQLAQAGVAAIAVHTNLDRAVGGVGDTLVEALGLLPQPTDDPFLRLGRCPEPTDPHTFAREVARRLKTSVRLHAGTAPISTVAVACGAGGNYAGKLGELGADALVTGEVKHHEWLLAGTKTVVDAGHAATERCIVPVLCAWLTKQLPSVRFIAAATELPYESVDETGRAERIGGGALWR